MLETRGTGNLERAGGATGTLLEVDGIRADEIAYNPAVIIQKNGNKIASGASIIAARVESLGSYWLSEHYDPHVLFFTRQGNHLVLIPDTPIFRQYEDPWATWLTGKNKQPQLLFGGVLVDYSDKKPVITTQLHLAPSVQELNPDRFFMEIRGMKDVRFAQLPTGQLAVFTRPTTGNASPGRIGLKIINSLRDINNPKMIQDAELLKFDLGPDCKIGANEAFFVEKTGLLHVFCHIATVDGTDFEDESSPLHYAGYEFDVDPNAPFDKIIIPTLVAMRSDFPKNTGNSKSPKFNDVLFPGGTGGPNQTEFYVGLGDARIGVINLS
jgi:hypothetical protein